MENKITISELNPSQGLLVWDDEQNLVIGVITSTGINHSEKNEDLSSRIIDMVEDEYNAENVKILTDVHINGIEDDVFFDVETLEDDDTMIRKLRITKIGVY